MGANLWLVEPLLDRLGRPLETLRVSVTDRCNFRCVYCMPKEVFGREYEFLERSQLLSLEEIARVAKVFARLGVRTVRITGGEPLVRRNVEYLVELLAAIPRVAGGDPVFRPGVGGFAADASSPDPRNANRRERGGLVDHDLAGAAELQEGEERDRLLDARELGHLPVEVEARAASQH